MDIYLCEIMFVVGILKSGGTLFSKWYDFLVINAGATFMLIIITIIVAASTPKKIAELKGLCVAFGVIEGLRRQVIC